MVAKRPLTQREIRNIRRKSEDSKTISVFNPKKRVVHLQVREPSSDFYMGEQTIRISPNRAYVNKLNNFNINQLNNLRARGDIRIIGSLD